MSSVTETMSVGSPAPHSSPPLSPRLASSSSTCHRWSSPECEKKNQSVYNPTPQKKNQVSSAPRWKYLCDHPTDVTGVGRQQDGVGLLGQVGEGGHILLGDAERSCRVSVLHKEIHLKKERGNLQWRLSDRQPTSDVHLQRQSLRQDADRLRFRLRFGQDRLGLTCGEVEFNVTSPETYVLTPRAS